MERKDIKESGEKMELLQFNLGLLCASSMTKMSKVIDFPYVCSFNRKQMWSDGLNKIDCMKPKTTLSFLLYSSKSHLAVSMSCFKNPAFHKKVLPSSITPISYTNTHAEGDRNFIWMEVTLFFLCIFSCIYMKREREFPHFWFLFHRLNIRCYKCVILHWKSLYNQRIFTLCEFYWWLVWS